MSTISRGVYAGRLEQIKGVFYSLPKFLGTKSTNPREKSTFILRDIINSFLQFIP